MDLDAGAGEARVARARVGRVALAGLARGVDVGEHVVDDPAVARPVLDRRDVHVLGQVGRDHEAAVDVVARRRGSAKSSGGSRTRSGVPRAQSSAKVGGRRAGRPGRPAGRRPRPRRRGWRSSAVGERAVVLELRADARAPASTGASAGPRPPRRCRRPACGPARRSPAGTARPGPCGGTPGSSSGGSRRRPSRRSAPRPALAGSGIGQPTASTCVDGRPRGRRGRRRRRRAARGSRGWRSASAGRRTGRRSGRGSGPGPRSSMTNASGVTVAPSLRGERAVAVADDRELQAEVLGVRWRRRRRTGRGRRRRRRAGRGRRGTRRRAG